MNLRASHPVMKKKLFEKAEHLKNNRETSGLRKKGQHMSKHECYVTIFMFSLKNKDTSHWHGMALDSRAPWINKQGQDSSPFELTLFNDVTTTTTETTTTIITRIVGFYVTATRSKVIIKQNKYVVETSLMTTSKLVNLMSAKTKQWRQQQQQQH